MKNYWQNAVTFDEYIKEKKYTGIKSLVAFSGKLEVDGT